MQKNENLKYYSAFSHLSVRPYFKSKLFEYFDFDIERAFKADKVQIQKMSEELDINIPQDYFTKKTKINPEECYKNDFAKKEVNILTYEDEKYPKLLKEIPDFPLSLYYLGNIEDIDFTYPIAMVGSRRATSQAISALNNIISGLRNSNIVIISGLAYGIDAAAHIGALENNIKTIGVIASGLDVIYPYQNKKIYQDIIKEKGLIFSEYPLGVEPFKYNFPQRNRIVVGLSKGTLVAEAQIKSGAMISANLTLDYNRELMCIPGNVLNPNTSGIYKLIKEGASIVTNTEDLLNALNWDIKPDKIENRLLNPIEQKIINMLSFEDKSFDEIALEIKEEFSSIMIALTELELKGLIKQANGKYDIVK
ncbi:DNA-processing protein DprA [bacterium]|nr:DNA-processing protein DprA [bacterium]